jgi:hypothetical protein
MALVNDPFRCFSQNNYEKLMKNLYLGDCQFWPIYREEIKDFLTPSTPSKVTLESKVKSN